ncbi:MAG TPA: hypothetical protein PLA71_00355 [Saccharofermentans sp.]|nr:hypothetical protein [Saccharofermentans sp.]
MSEQNYIFHIVIYKPTGETVFRQICASCENELKKVVAMAAGQNAYYSIVDVKTAAKKSTSY